MLRLISFLDGLFRKFRLIAILLPLGLIAWVVGGSWFVSKEKEVVYPTELTEAVKKACERARAALPDQQIHGQPTLVLPLTNDNDLLVTKMLRDELNSGAEYRSVDTALWDKVVDEVREQFGGTQEAEFSLDEARRRGDGAGAKYVITGRVLETRGAQASSEEGFAKFKMQLVRVESNAPAAEFEGTFSSLELTADKPSRSEIGGWLGRLASRQFIFVVLVFAVLWPLAMIGVMRRVLRAENNPLNLFTLVVIAAVPIALAYPWAFAADFAIWRFVIYLVGGLLTTIWCIYVMSCVAETVKY